MFALVDCNNFYASCERVFNPALEHKPLVILSNNDGCVIARSNEAKVLGIKMGAPAFKMLDVFEKNDVHVYSSNYALYGDMSERVMFTLMQMVPSMEVYSIDEAFLDMRGMEYHSLKDAGKEIRHTIKKHTGIPVSVGISLTKTLAKVANHIAKKNPSYKGVCAIEKEDEIKEILKDYPIEEIWGIGRQYTKFLKNHNINTALELINKNDSFIKKYLSVVGLRMVSELRGDSCIELTEEAAPKKAICTSRSFGKMSGEYEVLQEAVANHAARCAEKLRLQSSAANLISVFLETNKFKSDLPQYFNIKTLQLPVASNTNNEIIKFSLIALNKIFKKGYMYKKAGVIVSCFVSENNIQENIFYEEDKRKKDLMKTLDKINGTYGRDFVKVAAQGFSKKWKLRQEKLSRNFTTRWSEILEVKS